MREMRFLALAPLLLAALAAAPAQETRVVTGHYTVSWEEQSLRPCGGARWWVADPGPLLRRYRDLVEGEYGSIFVTVRVSVSGEGAFGHMGMYRRTVAVREVMQARLPTREDCDRASET